MNRKVDIKLFAFKVISNLIRLYNYMDDLTAIPMMHKQQSIINIIQSYGKRLFNYIRSRVKNDEDAEDILQDVWYQLTSIIDIQPIEQLSSWLYRVSSNKIIDKKRKKKPLLLEDFAYEDEDGEMVLPEGWLKDNTNPEKEYESKYIRELFFSALKELPEKQRQVFLWNELEDLTLQEIADKTGENIKTIISRKQYAVTKLRELLKNINKEY
jgi:RNA polymerase sigma factor (sigma-70 family)